MTKHNPYHTISSEVARPIEGRANGQWWLAFALASVAALWGFWCMWLTVRDGIGVWGLNKTVGWAWDITNFVWWVRSSRLYCCSFASSGA